ncbi:MAG TPA: tyrosine--tRNA ligase [Bacilli bacterium]|nr:MAG: Tyrosine--tRNA ligase [Tenericutes bacterium ADurb.BinA124]HNZ50004.1 tyrosine--tRNA ligase [Bacilli bacterium]HOH17953.1 tyrosine--tRNA ligase [Bacilli bacterium]HPN60683.1 tyrosine--tRNA ligase [Bacilli bacterium]HPX84364.1 tyrosine--tRNA ligase [Bacilli bacterium]
MNLLEDLKWRGLVYDIINEEELSKRLEEAPITLYCGFDPTADSLHVGSLLPIVTLMRFYRAGHRVIALTGGGTGLIGDPSGKRNERQMNEVATVHKWGALFKKQFARFLVFDGERAFCVDNYEWLSKLSAIDMCREFGKHFNINQMLAKESVKSRLDSGLTYLEFSYMILQSIDFLHMYQDANLHCEMQIGGQDQWGNITAGMDLIRKVVGSEAKVFGLTLPLITKSDGTKFGKTESGAIWLDEDKTSPYEMYQFFINTADADVIRFLKYYTFLSHEQILDLEEKVTREPHLRAAQKVLAKEIVCLVHGEEAYNQAIAMSEALFSGQIGSLTAKEISVGFSDVPSLAISEDLGLIETLVLVKAASSKREARELIQNKAISINGEIISSLEHIVRKAQAIERQFTVIRRGKKNYYLIKHQ